MVKKNNKGFTLVELLAVIAILGLLTVFVVPQVYSLITDSRKKIYVQDAKRLVTQARYTMNAKNIKIEKPENGELIVFSMKYLSVSEFQNPPNGGKYLPEGSFVVVKNVGGEFKYSVMIVERTKDSQYMGVRLTSEEALDQFPTNTLVETFNDHEVGYIDESLSYLNNGSVINAAYINSNIRKASNDATGDWVDDDDDIIGYYNNDEAEDKPLTDMKAPKITAKFSGSGSLQTTLTVVATDSDNASNELTVCVKVSGVSTSPYPDPTNASDYSSYCANYGNDRFYSKEIDFEANGFSYDEKKTAYVYITVSDPSSNVTRKKMTYEIHENEKPVIDTYRVESNDGGIVNLPTAKVTLFASDDMTASDDLLVCFVQDDPTAETCEGYKKYSELFNASGVYLYTFKNSEGANVEIPDGRNHSLKVFVQDNLGITVSESREYQLYNNAKPVITNYSITPFQLTNVYGEAIGVSLTAQYFITASDDIATFEEMNICTQEVGTGVDEECTKYSDYMNDPRTIIFSGTYDGRDRQLKVYVTDNYNIASDPVYLTLTGVYNNHGPSIDEFTVASDGAACNGAASCTTPTEGGGYKVEVNLVVSDDLTNVNDMKVCVSENFYDCDVSKVNTASFVKYSDFNRSLTLSKGDLEEDFKYPSPNIVKHLYAAVVDSYGSYSGTSLDNPLNYTLYANHAPFFHNNHTVSSDGGTYSITTQNSEGQNVTEEIEVNLSTVQIGLDHFFLYDDFENVNAKFCYRVGSGEDTCTDFQSFNTLKETLSSTFTFKNADGTDLDYRGQTITSYFVARDHYGEEAVSPEVQYVLFYDMSPTIVSASISSTETNYNSVLANVSFVVNDFCDVYSVCVTSEDECSNDKYISEIDGSNFTGNGEVEYTIPFDGSSSEGWSSDYEDDVTNKILNLFVKDSHGNVVKKELSYDVYKICANPEQMTLLSEEDDSAYTFITPAEGDSVQISTAMCEGSCFERVTNSEDVGHRNYFDEYNSISGNYHRMLNYVDNVVSKNCEIDDVKTFHCNYAPCFRASETTNKNIIALKLEEEDKVWSYRNSEFLSKVEKSDAYCSSSEQAYFNETDPRCEPAPDGTTGTSYAFCTTQPETYCTRLADDEQEASHARDQALIDEYNSNMIAYEDARTEIRNTIWLAYNEGHELYLTNYNACLAEDAAGLKAFEDERDTQWTNLVNIFHKERETLGQTCDDLNSHSEEERAEALSVYYTNSFCTQVRTCEESSNPELVDIYCYKQLDAEPVPDVENIFVYTPGDINMCGDFAPDPEQLQLGEKIFLYQYSCDHFDEFDEAAELALMEEQFLLDYGEYHHIDCSGFEDPDIPNLCFSDAANKPYCDDDPHTQGYCTSPEEWQAIMADHTCDNPDELEDEEQIEYCDNLEQLKQRDHCEGFDDLTKPSYPDLENFDDEEKEKFYDECLLTALNDCNTLLDSFCPLSEDQRKYPVSCSSTEQNEGPYWCRDTGIAGMYCTQGFTEEGIVSIDCDAENDPECDFPTCPPDNPNCHFAECSVENDKCHIEHGCSDEDPDCHRVCYRNVDCTIDEVWEPTTYLCLGYYKVYQGSIVNDKVQLQETGMRICPDFYRQHSDYYAFNDSNPTPFIKFNPSEIEGGTS